MSGKILPLSEAVRSKLRSGITITSVAQCVEELVLNSVDAGATCIAVRVDPTIFRIQVVDNGEGVTEDNLKLLGRRHATSKCHSLEDLNFNLGHYGFRGEALASLVDVAAIVDVTTRPRGSMKTVSKIFMYGKEKSVSVAKVPRPSVGTTITIQDFMYNMPVRRKLMKEAIDIENIRARLESFALMHPNVSFSLRNDNGQVKVMQTKKANTTLSTFMQLFGLERSQGLVEVEHSVDQFKVSGYISVQPHLTKVLQFIYVNKRVVLKTKLHKMMNYLLDHTSIISNRLHPAAPLPGKSPSSPPKGMKLHSIYVINVECPLKEYDICMDPTKTLVEFKDWDKLLLCIEEMVIKFAEEEGLTISLDERFKRSGRDQVAEEEDKDEESHSSQALLQIFSLKRPGEVSDSKGGSREKYGRTLCTQDNLAAIHSLPVRRKRSKSIEKLENSERNSDDEEASQISRIESSEEKEKIDNLTEVCSSKEKGKGEPEELGEKSDQCSSPSRNLSPKLQYLRSPEKRLESLNKIRSSLELFKRSIMQDDPPAKDQSVNQVTLSRKAEQKGEETCNVSDTNEANKKRSSLQEFIDFYQEDLKKSKQELYETPKDMILPPPKDPPPLRRTSPQVTSSQQVTQEDSVDTPGESEEVQEQCKRPERSLSKALSEGWRRQQAKTKTLKDLQKFEFQKVSSHKSPLSAGSLDNKESQRKKKKIECLEKKGQRTTPSRRCKQQKSMNQVTTSVREKDFEDGSTRNDESPLSSSDNLECSFKFQPVIASEIEHTKAPETKRSKENVIVSHTTPNIISDESQCDSNQPEFQEPLMVQEGKFKDTNTDENILVESIPQIQRANMKQQRLQSIAHAQGQLVAETERNLVYHAREMSPTQPFVVEIPTQKSSLQIIANQTIGENCSHKIVDTHEQISSLSSGPTSTKLVNCIKMDCHGSDQNVHVDKPDVNSGNVECSGIMTENGINDTHNENIISSTVDIRSMQLPEEKTMKATGRTFEEKDIHFDSEVDFKLLDSSSRTFTSRENVTENLCLENNFNSKGIIESAATTASTVQNNWLDKNSTDTENTAGPSVEDISSQNPLSASLHFSQLTLPSTEDSGLHSHHSSSAAEDPNSGEPLGLSLPSLSSIESYTAKGSENSKSKMPSYDIVFHGKMIHIDGKNTHLVDEDVKDLDPKEAKAPSRLLQVQTESSGSESEGLLRKSLERQISKLEENPLHILNSTESNNKNKNTTNESLDRSVPDGINDDSMQCGFTEGQLPSMWKEATDENGRRVYVHLRTGNTSYEPPMIKETPEWTCSQPQGAPIMKIPLSEEPEAEGGHHQQDFVLTHGYSAFMSWKKRRAMEKMRESKKLRETETEISGRVAVDEQENVSKESDSLVSLGMKEAIQSILQDSEVDDLSIKWADKPSELSNKEEETVHSEVAQICQTWEPPTFAMDSDILISKVHATNNDKVPNKNSSVRIYNIVHPYKFTREMLHTCKVLGQLDKKFIACSITYTPSEPNHCTVSKLVVLFDQHAVHERIRLENFTEENYKTLETGDKVICSSMITPPLEMVLPESEIRLMMAYMKTFIQWGLHFTQVSTSKVNFHSIPSILVAREAHELRQRRCQSATSIIESMVRDICHTLHQTGGIVSTMPKPLFNVLCNQACRGAIKFGDELSFAKCEDLIKSLCSCTLPFQCAHGRPSIVPVVNMTHLTSTNKKEEKPNLHKLRESMLEDV